MQKLIFYLNIFFGLITITGTITVLMSFFLLVWGIDLPVLFIARVGATTVITLALWAFLSVFDDIISS